MNLTPLARVVLGLLGILAMSVAVPASINETQFSLAAAAEMAVYTACGWRIWDAIGDAAPRSPGPWLLGAWAAVWLGTQGLGSSWAGPLDLLDPVNNRVHDLAFLLLIATITCFPGPRYPAASAAVVGGAALAIALYPVVDTSLLVVLIWPLALMLLLLAIRHTNDDLAATRAIGALLFGTGLLAWGQTLMPPAYTTWMAMYYAERGLFVGMLVAFAVWRPWGVTLRRRDLIVYPLVAVLALGAVFVIANLSQPPDSRNGLNRDYHQQMTQYAWTIILVVSIGVVPLRRRVDQWIASITQSKQAA